MTRYEELEVELAAHNKAYWVDNTPIISDPDYDVLMQEFLALSPPADHELLNYTGSVGPSERKKVQHDIPMISLDKVYTEEEFLSWAKGVARSPQEIFIINPKFDGLAVDLTAGTLATKEEDISDKYSYIKNPPIAGQRGELCVLKSDKPDNYKTPRAAASGIARGSSQKFSHLLTFFPYDAHAEECTLEGLSEISWKDTMLDTMQEDYPTDGLVIALKDKAYGETLGGTDHHPNHSIAFKYGNPIGETKLIDVIWQLGKRKLTPVGIIEPVEIDGYTNTRISLHNIDEASKVKIGDQIIVQRCGQVIPQLHSVKKTFKSSKVIWCDVCPACGTDTVYTPATDLAAASLTCPNENCGGMLAKRLHDSLCRLGVENIGPATCSDLVSAGYNSLHDVFELSVKGWLALPGFAKKSANQRVESLATLVGSSIEDYKILAALNIEGVGLSLSKKICSSMTLPEIEACEDFTGLESVGRIISEKLVKGIFDMFGLLRWMKLNFTIKETKGLAARPLVVFTGKSDVSRDDWVKFAAEKGYAFHKQVNKKVSLVVCSDVNSTSTKAKKARAYGIKLMSYAEFKES